MESVPTESPFTDTEFPESLFPESPFDDIIYPCEEYETWEGIPVSTLQFRSNTFQICYVAIDKNKITNRNGILLLPKGTQAYEYRGNLNRKKGETILQVTLDTTNMVDTTNLTNTTELAKLNHINNDDSVSLIRMVEPVTILGITKYKIVYKIKDNGAVKDIKIIEQTNNGRD